MPALSTWNLDQTRILTRRELADILADLAPRSARSANVQRNLVIARLACCCGLRVTEIANLQRDDVVVDVTRPHLRLRWDLEAQRAGGGNCVMHNTICSNHLASSPIRLEERLSCTQMRPFARVQQIAGAADAIVWDRAAEQGFSSLWS
jgi:hypothetical protein